MDRTILHIDMNSFYASVECLYNPEIRDKPVAVGGSEALRHGIILAKNEEAKKFGIKTGETIMSAKRKCPNLIIIPPDFKKYIYFSDLAKKIYLRYSDLFEPFGIDEGWLDVTASTKIYGNGEKIAGLIKEQIKEELGITVSIGVSFNKVFAKLGSDYKKPDAITVFTRENYKSLIWPLPASSMLYVGPSSSRKLKLYGINTIGDLANTPESFLINILGKWGIILKNFASGSDLSPVMRFDENIREKSVGNSITTPKDLKSKDDVKLIIYMLSESVALRMRKKGFYGDTVTVHIRDNTLFSFSRQGKLSSFTCCSKDIAEKAMSLFEKNYFWQNNIRSIGVSVSNIVEGKDMHIQYDIFGTQELKDRQEALEKAIDSIKERFGPYAVRRAVMLTDESLTKFNPKDDHTISPVPYR